MTNDTLTDAGRAALLAEKLIHRQFPRSAQYDLEWQFQNAMGPNPLWLAESLCEVMTLTPGMRVLDLGCGRAASSIFLAREFGVHVVAADLWIKPSENWLRILEADVGERVMPLHADAHDLKFADGYFDAIVCLDAYNYFGTDDLYVAHLIRFLKPGGRLGIVVPAVTNELDGEIPAHLLDHWDWDFCSFHSPDWWRRHWTKTGKVQVERADLLPDGWRHWLRWEQLGAVIGKPDWRERIAGYVRMLDSDAGRTLGFARVVGRGSD